MARSDWTAAEIGEALDLYRDMLENQRQQRKYSKAETVRGSALIATRTRGSIERKLQNVSAVRQELGLDWIHGYKPLPHYQALLREEVRKREGVTEP